MFRSCAASLSLTRSVSGRSRRLIMSKRHYSDAASSNATTEEGKDGLGGEAKAETEVLLSRLKAKDAEVVDLTGRLRYLQADFLNLQRNAAREKEQTRDFAITRFASDLLDIVDVLSLALKSVPQSILMPPESSEVVPPPSTPKSPVTYLNELHTGVEMTHRLLLQTLFKYHVKPFDPMGDKFDPNRHEALYQVPTSGKEPGTIIDCQKIGYTIKDRILRAAQVGVAQEAQS